MSRRQMLRLAGLVAGALLLAGCAGLRSTPERIVDVATGRDMTRAELVARLRGADYVMLGELHDNRRHHVLRGELVVDLGRSAVVVAEQMPAGRRVGEGADLKSRLTAAGFDDRAWGWPIHEALFAPVLAAGIPVLGGNAPADQVRQVARAGVTAWPSDARLLLEAAPLSAAAQAALANDLTAGHCGQLPAARVPSMGAAQRLRDAVMWSTLRDAGGRPAVLVAGNGHTRRDYGVPQLAAALAPQARTVSVGFGESGDAVSDAPYDIVWLTLPAKREDPCVGLKLKP